jgi:nucleotide-binding universal stress UspA family protein
VIGQTAAMTVLLAYVPTLEGEVVGSTWSRLLLRLDCPVLAVKATA